MNNDISKFNKYSNNPDCPESVRRNKLSRDALIWLINWRDQVIIDSKSRDVMEQYSDFFYQKFNI